LSGARLVVVPDKTAQFEAAENIIIGNVAFYGATSGEAYINGMAGERFGVRNSGVKTVVEGIGDHGCEYMTGGVVVVLGDTGKNFAAGMSGGKAFIFDKNKTFHKKVNREMIDLDPLSQEDWVLLKGLIENHAKLTNSKVAKSILKNWEKHQADFIKVMPRDYKAVLEKRKKIGGKEGVLR
jgi:glutamate synthase (NADPH/NADH) large chain